MYTSRRREPNPVSNELRISMSGVQTSPVVIEIADMLGHIVYNKQYTGNTLDGLKVNTNSLAPGIYMIKIFNNKKQLFTTQKFVKQ